MGKSQFSKYEEKEEKIFEHLCQKSSEDESSLSEGEDLEMARIARKKFAREEESKLKEWQKKEDFEIKLKYGDYYDALPAFYNQERLLLALFDCVKKSNSYDLLLAEDVIPPIIPIETNSQYLGNQVKNYICNIDYNFFISRFAQQFSDETEENEDLRNKDKFYRDYSLRFSGQGYASRIDTNHSDNFGAKTLSNILEFLKITYLNNKSTFRAMAYPNSKVSFNFYAPIIVKKKADTTGKQAIQMNCLAFRSSFVEKLGYSDNIDFMQARNELLKLTELAKERLEIIAFNSYDCNEFWICKSLRIPISKFQKLSRTEKSKLLETLLIERNYYS